MSGGEQKPAELRAVARNHWQLSGVLDFATVPLTWEHLQPLLSVPGSMEISLAGVSHANSAGLALLLQALERSEGTGCELRYTHIPDELIALAQISNCEDLLSSEI